MQDLSVEGEAADEEKSSSLCTAVTFALLKVLILS